MSRNTKNNVSEQKYCKVCQDAGKSESEFYSHFTRESRDPTSKVTCPLLLALECRYCFKSGHTVKYCPSIKAKDKQNRREEASYRFYETRKKASTPINNTTQNVFMCLNCDSDDDDDTNVKNNSLTNEFPELVQMKRSAPLNNNSYAAALATPVPVPVHTKIPDSVASLEVKLPNNIKKLSTISWADMESDTDDDDDDDEEEKMYNSNVNNMVEVAVGGYESDW
jgi:hypothetical protein